ncbi:hypothetical protein D3C87_1681390 [compost metagenome]
MIETEHIHIAELRQTVDADGGAAPEGHLPFPGIMNIETIKHFLEQAVFAKHQHMTRIQQRDH